MIQFGRGRYSMCRSLAVGVQVGLQGRFARSSRLLCQGKGFWYRERNHHVSRSVARGRGVFVFPEGTRSRSGCLQQMRDGFFGFALKERCEILPMGRDMSPCWFVRVGKAEIAFADPIDVAKLPEDETLDSLKARVQKAMLAALRTCPSYDTAIESRINETPTSRGGGLRG
eukprot:Polyplicarium_translucidae@DN1926_c0_g1_i5.p1